MRKAIQIDEAEYKLALTKGAETLINKNKRDRIKNAEVNAIDGEYWLSYDEADYMTGWNRGAV